LLNHFADSSIFFADTAYFCLFLLNYHHGFLWTSEILLTQRILLNQLIFAGRADFAYSASFVESSPGIFADSANFC